MQTDPSLAGILIQETNSEGLITSCQSSGNLDTTASKFAKGCVLVDTTTGLAYYNSGSVAVPVWNSTSEVTADEMPDNTIKTATITLTAAEIVGTDAGDIGHASGAVLVAAPGAGKLLEFVSAVCSYTYDTAAYTGGADDCVIRQGATAVSAPIAKADLLADTASDIAYVNALSAADIKLTANSTLNFAGTAFTQPGTAAGTLKILLTYREHTL